MKKEKNFFLSFDFDSIDWEKMSRDSYEIDRSCPENFSNWVHEIKSYGKFSHAKIINNQILTFEELRIFEESKPDDSGWEKMKQILKPSLDKMEDNKNYSIKTGTFSNKFSFHTSIANKSNLATKFWYLNQVGGPDVGHSEIVIREYIENTDNTGNTPTIYHGLPLREEVRVFYHLERKKMIAIGDYWDYESCINGIDEEDKACFNMFHNLEGNRTFIHGRILEAVISKVKEDIVGLELSDRLKEIEEVWSIDFMPIIDFSKIRPNSSMEEIKANMKIYLIDMARGSTSYYNDKIHTSWNKV